MNTQLLYLLQVSAGGKADNIFTAPLSPYATAFGMSAGSGSGSMVPVIINGAATSIPTTFGMYAQTNNSSGGTPMNFHGYTNSYATPFGIQPTNNVGGYTYRYIKFDQLNSDPGQLVGLIDIGLLTSYGADWVTISKATVTGSSQYDQGLRLENLVDGNLGTRWVSAATGPQWVTIDLNSARQFSRVMLTMYSSETPRAPKSMTILGSLDGIEYTEIGTFAGLTYPDVINGTTRSQTLII